jgi:hypothetical protein
MNAGRFLWGITTLALGALLFATTMGVLPEKVWMGVLYLWPIGIVLLGLSFLIRNRVTFALVGTIIILSAIVLAVYYGPGGYGANNVENKVTQQRSSLGVALGDQKLALEVDTGAVQLDISAMTTEQAKTSTIIVEAAGMNKIQLEETRDKGEVRVRLSEKATENSAVFTTDRKLHLLVSPNVELSLVVNVGASKLNLDLASLKTSALSFNSGAVSASVKIGTLADAVSLNLQSGASDYQLLIPKDSGVSVVTRSGLSNLTLPDGKSSIKFEDSYKSDGFDATKKKVNVDIRTGLTNVKISNY